MIDSISSASFATYGQFRRPQGERSTVAPDQQDDERASKLSSKAKEEKFTNPQKLDEAEKKQVEELKKRDAEVRAHEQSHMAAAGSLAFGGPSFIFQTGPDGRQYAIGGSVKIDTSPGNTPEETQRKAQQMRSAALAPDDPSGADLKVAASAATLENEAIAKTKDKAEKNQDKSQNPGEKDDDEKSEITSSRQIVSAGETDSQNGDSQDPDSQSKPNAYLLQAAKLYQRQQAETVA